MGRSPPLCGWSTLPRVTERKNLPDPLQLPAQDRESLRSSPPHTHTLSRGETEAQAWLGALLGLRSRNGRAGLRHHSSRLRFSGCPSSKRALFLLPLAFFFSPPSPLSCNKYSWSIVLVTGCQVTNHSQLQWIKTTPSLECMIVWVGGLL